MGYLQVYPTLYSCFKRIWICVCLACLLQRAHAHAHTHARMHSGPKLQASCCRANYAAHNNGTPNRAAFLFIRPRSIHLASSFIYQVFIYSPDTLCRPIMGIVAARIMGSPPTLVLFTAEGSWWKEASDRSLHSSYGWRRMPGRALKAASCGCYHFKGAVAWFLSSCDVTLEISLKKKKFKWLKWIK